jgi:GDP-L-fucose synthase
MRLLVTGAHGFLGQHLVPLLSEYDLILPERRECDWRNKNHVIAFFQSYVPHAVIHLAANVGGIGYNQKNPGTLWRDNLEMGINILEASRIYDVEKLVMVSTTCAYPKFCETPFKESSLWDGYPEETNAPYGIAKRALMTGALAYRKEFGLDVVTAIPTNLYGEGDNFSYGDSHVIPALIRKFTDGEDSVTLWGSGKATRDFLYAGDCARALVRMLEDYSRNTPINLGSGEEISIGELAVRISKLCGWNGKIHWDSSKPDGQPRRLLSTTNAKAALHWHGEVNLEEGLKRTIGWWRANRC